MNFWMQKLTKLISAIKFLLLPVAIFLTLLILALSLIKTDGLPKLEVNQADKYFHATAYFFLTAAWIFAFHFQLKRKNKSAHIGLLLFIILFGIIIEILQMTVTNYRSFDIFDILANSIGAGLFYMCYIIAKRIYPRLKDKN